MSQEPSSEPPDDHVIVTPRRNDDDTAEVLVPYLRDDSLDEPLRMSLAEFDAFAASAGLDLSLPALQDIRAQLTAHVVDYQAMSEDRSQASVTADEQAHALGTSLLYKYLDAELERRLATRATPSGWTFADLIRCGRAFPNCDIGVHAGDAASYDVFAPLLDPIIADVHGCQLGRGVVLGRSSSERPRMDASLREDLAVLWTTVRVTRNLRSSQFPALMGRRARLEAERRIKTALAALGPRYDGRYYRHAELPSPRRHILKAHNLWFDGNDRYLAAAGITRDWPEGRALWSTDDRRLVVWVNEEDHLRILSRSPDGDLAACLALACELAWALEELLGFHHDERLGYLASCPSNVGTGLRASATLRLPRLAERPEELRELIETLGLDLRGRRGERSTPSDAVVDVANRRRLGASEAESVERLANALRELLAAERSTSGRRAFAAAGFDDS